MKIKEVIRGRQSKDIQCNVKRKKYERANNDLQDTKQKTKDIYINTKHYTEN
jgi:hypothetical protein